MSRWWFVVVAGALGLGIGIAIPHIQLTAEDIRQLGWWSIASVSGVLVGLGIGVPWGEARADREWHELQGVTEDPG